MYTLNKLYIHRNSKLLIKLHADRQTGISDIKHQFKLNHTLQLYFYSNSLGMLWMQERFHGKKLLRNGNVKWSHDVHVLLSICGNLFQVKINLHKITFI